LPRRSCLPVGAAGRAVRADRRMDLPATAEPGEQVLAQVVVAAGAADADQTLLAPGGAGARLAQAQELLDLRGRVAGGGMEDGRFGRARSGAHRGLLPLGGITSRLLVGTEAATGRSCRDTLPAQSSLPSSPCGGSSQRAASTAPSGGSQDAPC